MTVPRERTNAVMFTENFLLRLIDPKQTPRVPRAIRQEAHRLLRHYPSRFEMEVISAREDDEPEAIKMKIFGRGYS
jgi:hypothetical protein